MRYPCCPHTALVLSAALNAGAWFGRSITRNYLRGRVDVSGGTGALETLIVSSNYLSCDVKDLDSDMESRLGEGVRVINMLKRRYLEARLYKYILYIQLLI